MLKGLNLMPERMQEIKLIDTSMLDREKIPRHVAVIMDGNGRWAKAQGKPRTYGHSAGAQTLKTVVRLADKIGIKVLSAYAFSTENWKRPVTEVSFIMNLLQYYLAAEIDEFNANNVQVRFMGSREGLPEVVKENMDRALSATHNNTGIILNLAINYGGQAEILRATRALAQRVAEGNITVNEIDGAMFESELYTQGLPPPDLLIRPGGDLRISNFLLWQIAYAEIWTTEVYWPAFSQELFLEAISSYANRERRYGGLVVK